MFFEIFKEHFKIMKVYILLIQCPSMVEILGVYANLSKAYEAYKTAFGEPSAGLNPNMITIVEKELIIYE